MLNTFKPDDLFGAGKRIPYMGTEPVKGRPEDAAYDLRAEEGGVVGSGDTKLVRTGTQLGIPEGYVGLVCSRSGLALNESVFVLNAPGIVDPGYTGDVGVILHNLGQMPFTYLEGARIAQLLIVPNPSTYMHHALGKRTERGDQGFGSSGVV